MIPRTDRCSFLREPIYLDRNNPVIGPAPPTKLSSHRSPRSTVTSRHKLGPINEFLRLMTRCRGNFARSSLRLCPSATASPLFLSSAFRRRKAVRAGQDLSPSLRRALPKKMPLSPVHRLEFPVLSPLCMLSRAPVSLSSLSLSSLPSLHNPPLPSLTFERRIL